jgi:hypothetical protein
MDSSQLTRIGIASGFADDLTRLPGNRLPRGLDGPNNGPGALPEPEFFPGLDSLFNPPGDRLPRQKPCEPFDKSAQLQAGAEGSSPAQPQQPSQEEPPQEEPPPDIGKVISSMAPGEGE